MYRHLFGLRFKAMATPLLCVSMVPRSTNRIFLLQMSDTTDAFHDRDNVLVDWFKNDSESAKKRNFEIVKNLEKAKAKLLSQAIYSPTEQARAAAVQRYKLEPSLIPKN